MTSPHRVASLVSLAVVALTISACSTPAPAASPPQVAATSAAPTKDQAVAACAASTAALEGEEGDPTDIATARHIAELGQQSANISIRLKAVMLGDRIELAEAAAGAPDEKTTVLKMWTAVVAFQTACVEQGF